MSLQEYRRRRAHDHQISEAVALRVAPGLMDLIESGQPLNHPEGVRYRSMNDSEVYLLVRCIAEYRSLMPEGSDERRRAETVLACGHGYHLVDSCPMCADDAAPSDGQPPLIALVPVPHEEEDSGVFFDQIARDCGYGGYDDAVDRLSGEAKEMALAAVYDYEAADRRVKNLDDRLRRELRELGKSHTPPSRGFASLGAELDVAVARRTAAADRYRTVLAVAAGVSKSAA